MIDYISFWGRGLRCFIRHCVCVPPISICHLLYNCLARLCSNSVQSFSRFLRETSPCVWGDCVVVSGLEMSDNLIASFNKASSNSSSSPVVPDPCSCHQNFPGNLTRFSGIFWRIDERKRCCRTHSHPGFPRPIWRDMIRWVLWWFHRIRNYVSCGRS